MICVCFVKGRKCILYACSLISDISGETTTIFPLFLNSAWYSNTVMLVE